MDINVKDLKKNAFRYSKVRGETASRIRITGGKINAKVMRQVAEIAEEYGDGTIFITNRQGIELLGIPMEKMDEVNQKLQPNGQSSSPGQATIFLVPEKNSVRLAAMIQLLLPEK